MRERRRYEGKRREGRRRGGWERGRREGRGEHGRVRGREGRGEHRRGWGRTGRAEEGVVPLQQPDVLQDEFRGKLWLLQQVEDILHFQQLQIPEEGAVCTCKHTHTHTQMLHYDLSPAYIHTHTTSPLPFTPTTLPLPLTPSGLINEFISGTVMMWAMSVHSHSGSRKYSSLNLLCRSL